MAIEGLAEILNGWRDEEEASWVSLDNLHDLTVPLKGSRAPAMSLLGSCFGCC